MPLEDAVAMSPQNSDHSHCIGEFAEIALRSVNRRDGYVGNGEARVRRTNDEISFELVSVALRVNLFENFPSDSTIARLTVAHCTTGDEPRSRARKKVRDAAMLGHLLLAQVAGSDRDVEFVERIQNRL